MFALFLTSTVIFLLSWLAPCLAQTQCADNSALVPFLRAINSAATDHFYTTNVTEMFNVAIAKDGYALEGDSAFIWSTQQPGTTPLYRLDNINESDHFYTISSDEVPEMMAAGWTTDTTPIAGYVYPYNICGASPIYRLFNPTIVDHFYTMDISESNAAVASGYQPQGIAGYVVLPSANGSVVLSSASPFLVPTSVSATAAPQVTSPCATSSDAVPLLRAFSSIGADHFYTTNTTEMANAVSLDAYSLEGDGAFVWNTQEPSTVPLYRMFNQNVTDHFYTMDQNETTEALSDGYTFDLPSHIAGYVYPYSICGASPIYRLYNPSATDHFYTMSVTESMQASGYVFEGIAGFALLPSADGLPQTAIASASPLFLPVLTPSETSVSLSSASEPAAGIPAFTISPGAPTSEGPGPSDTSKTSGTTRKSTSATLGLVVFITLWSSL